MSGRFAGSHSQDERRRRRLATDDPENQGAGAAEGEPRPLPVRAPSQQFPLRRMISRAYWKLALCLFGVSCVAAAVLALGHLPRVADGTYGPGLAGLASDHAARLVTVGMGLLLLAAAQLSWLIRWARSRSLRDVRGRYRIWWWSAAALALSGIAILIDGPAALAATIAWGTDWPPVLGSFAVYELTPALLALVILFPGLQRDMRGCRTSRMFLFFSALFLISAGGATVASDPFARLFNDVGARFSPRLAVQSLWLMGTVGLFGAFLFHARHVIYDSVEPPESGKRNRKEQSAAQGSKTSNPSSAKPAANAGVEENQSAQPSRAESKSPPAKSAAQERKSEPSTAKNRPAKSRGKTPAASAEPEQTRDDRWAEIGTIEVDGHVIRLDGPEDPMKGLSKRERRKVRKAIKDRQRNGVEEY